MPRYIHSLIAFFFSLCPVCCMQKQSVQLFPTVITQAAPGSIGWVAPELIGADDGNPTATTLEAGEISKTITTSTYGFSIPLNATIRGVEVKLKSSIVGLGVPTAKYSNVQLLIAGSPAGDDLSKSRALSIARTVDVFGGSTVKWGNNLTPAIINAGGLGFVFQIESDGSESVVVVFVDFVVVVVHYEFAGGLRAVAGQVFTPGAVAGQVYGVVPDHTVARQLFTPGAIAGQTFAPGAIARQPFTPGAIAGQVR